jgi:hypothetical protein
MGGAHVEEEAPAPVLEEIPDDELFVELRLALLFGSENVPALPAAVRLAARAGQQTEAEHECERASERSHNRSRQIFCVGIHTPAAH